MVGGVTSFHLGRHKHEVKQEMFTCSAEGSFSLKRLTALGTLLSTGHAFCSLYSEALSMKSDSSLTTEMRNSFNPSSLGYSFNQRLATSCASISPPCAHQVAGFGLTRPRLVASNMQTPPHTAVTCDEEAPLDLSITKPPDPTESSQSKTLCCMTVGDDMPSLSKRSKTLSLTAKSLASANHPALEHPYPLRPSSPSKVESRLSAPVENEVSPSLPARDPGIYSFHKGASKWVVAQGCLPLCPSTSEMPQGLESRDNDKEPPQSSSQSQNSSTPESFLSNINVNEQEEIDSQEGRHYCELCGKGYDYKRSLTKHVKDKHSPEGPGDRHYCEICGKGYGYKGTLTKHVKDKHNLEGPVSYKCSDCDKVLSSPYRLQEHHKAVHQGDPHRCKICRGEFHHSSSLKSHVKDKHGPEGPVSYNCWDCDKTFSSKSFLKIHQKAVHQGERIPCQDCGKKFRYQRDVTMHREREHGFVRSKRMKSFLRRPMFRRPSSGEGTNGTNISSQTTCSP